MMKHSDLERFLPPSHKCGGCGREIQIQRWADEWWRGQAVKVARSFCPCGKINTTIIGGDWDGTGKSA